MIKAKSHMVSMTLVITTALAGGAYASETKEIRIGLGAPLTGSNASYGKDLQNGVGLAVEQMNKTNPSVGGVPVKFVLDVEDDQGDARAAVTVAQKFIDNNVVAVIGHFNSGATMPASRLYDAAGIPMLTPASTNPGVTARGYKNVFRLLSNDDQMTTAAAGYVVNTLKATRIATLDDRTAFGQGEADLFAKKVTELGGKIVDQQFTNDKAVDFSAQLTHIKSSGADLIFFGGLDQQAALVAKKISQLGIKAQLMAGGAVADDLFIAVAGAAGEGTMAWETNAPLSTEGLGNKYLQDYKTRYGTQPLTFSPFAYDGANMVMQAVLSTGSTSGEELTKSLRSARYEGASGTIVFDDKGDRREAVNTLYQLKDGKFEVIATVKASN